MKTPAVVLVGLVSATMVAHAQQDRAWLIAAGASFMLNIGEGIARDCDSPGYAFSVTPRFGRRVATRYTSLELTLRNHGFGTAPSCVADAPPFIPPPDGVHIQEFGPFSLLGTSFLATDLRVRARWPTTVAAPTLSLGVGNAWASGRNDVPYVLVGGGLSVVSAGSVHVTLEGEYQALGVTAYRYRRTWLGGRQIGNEYLGAVRSWPRSALLGVVVGASF